jgi:hypothetical protein
MRYPCKSSISPNYKNTTMMDSSPKKLSAGQVAATSFTANALSYGHVLFGSTLLFAPSLVSSLLVLPIFPASATFIRLVGIRDAVLGEHLWFAARLPVVNDMRTDSEKKEIRRCLLANVAVDSVETIVLAYMFARDGIAARTAVFGGGGSLAFAVLGLLALRNM